MQVAVVSVGEAATPSTYYRIGQYLPLLEKEGIHCTLFPKKQLNWSSLKHFDLIINQKALVKPVSLNVPYLFDFDDAIWTRSERPYTWWTKWRVEKRLNTWLGNSSCVTVANGFLENWAKKSARRVEKIPMSLDLQRWRPYNVLKKMVIGWSGHPVNIPLLLDIESELKRLIAKYPHVELAVHCGKRPELSLPFRYVPYKPGFEQAFTQSLTVGLLPFSENEFTKGKSPIKALQYMACGVPVVGPAFGATKEIHSEAHGIVVQQGDWFAALSKAVEESQKMRFLGDQGRAFVERNHCMDKVGEQLVSIIKSSA